MKQRLFITGLDFCCLFLLSGCSAWMALSSKEQKDRLLISLGDSRAAVIAKLGKPDTSTKDPNGCFIDSYVFVEENNTPGSNRAMAYLQLDAATFGLGEVIWTPIEFLYAIANHYHVIVYYDSQDKIKQIKKIID